MLRSQSRYPLIPLKNIVVFPGLVVPIFVGRDKSLQALLVVAKNKDKNQKKVILSLQKINVEDPGINDVEKIGILADVEDIKRVDEHTYRMLVRGTQKVAINEIKLSGYFSATIENIQDIDDLEADEIDKSKQKIRELLDQYLSFHKNISAEVLNGLIVASGIAEMINIIGHFLMFSIEDKQKIFVSNSLKDKVERIKKILLKEIDIIEVEDKLHSSIKQKVEKTQKEFYLKEKIKAIKAELGDDYSYEDELDEYLSKIEESSMPENVKIKARREGSKLKKLQNVSSESGLIKTYLDWLVELPWAKYSSKKIKIKECKRILNKQHFALKEVKKRILEFLSVYKLSKNVQGSILCLTGPSGVGKTSIAKSISKALGRPFYKISLGGLSDEAELRGHRRTYVGSMPGRLIQAIHSCGASDPVILLDEIDKLSTRFQSNPAAVLLEILDPEQNKEFYDHYLEVPFDLSKVLFLTTANNAQDIIPSLLDRLEVIKVRGYSLAEKVQIVSNFFLPKLKKRNGLKKVKIRISLKAIKRIIVRYTKELGLRQLERKISEILRKMAVKKVKGKPIFKVKKSNLKKFLGQPLYDVNWPDHFAQKGIVNGLSYSDRGGDILSLEVAVYPGKGKIIMTGKLGKVMKESMRSAIGYIRSRHSYFKLKRQFFDKNDIHVHLPQNAIAKEGPSAGLAILVALVSAFTGNRISADCAFTGEITLKGRVLPVGGLREKLAAADLAGIKKVYLPKNNFNQARDYNDFFMKNLTLIPVRNAEDVLKRVFKNRKFINKKWLI